MSKAVTQVGKLANNYDPMSKILPAKASPGRTAAQREEGATRAENKANAQAAADADYEENVAGPERRRGASQIGDRREDMRAAAGAAGATRFDSDYDLLGRPQGIKRRGASRTLLGN